MTKKKNKALALALAACLSFGTLGAFGGLTAHEDYTASALSTSSTVAYPFEKGANAFQYAPTFTMAREQGTNPTWEFGQVHFDSVVDMTSARYLAVQFYIPEGNPGFTVGMIDSTNVRRNTYDNDGLKVYFLPESGAMYEMSILYGSITVGVGAKGAMLIPIDSLVTGGAGNIAAMESFYFETNAFYNWNFAFTIGEIGYYNGEPGEAGTTFTKVVDLSSGERAKDKYYVASTNVGALRFPSEEAIPEPEPPTLNAYPFRTGEEAYYNTETWSGFSVDGSKVNWQSVKVEFDNATADFTNADYLVVQYMCTTTSGLQYILNEGAHEYSTAGKDGERVYFAQEGQTASNLSCKILYDHVNVSPANKMGALIIPMTSLGWHGTAGDLSKIDALTVKTNSQYNGDFELLIGEIGMYDEDTETFTKLLDLSTDKSAKFTVSTQLDENKGTLTHFKAVLKQLGDASIDFRADKMTYADLTNAEPVYDEDDPTKVDHYTYTKTGSGIWTGGSYGKRVVEGITDSYGEQAVQLTTLGTNPYGDAYTAFDLAPAGGFSWANQKGISFWARNDSDTEISFNIEVDCRVPNPSGSGNISDRFNVKQGHRFMLYDINTEKTTVYMTRPCATLPVGFEGWVRIPFSAFARADWSNNGVTQDMFMGENSVVSYLAITVHAATYQNKSFTVNMFGAYSTSPSFGSALVPATGKTIPELMNLSELLNKEEN